MNDLPLKTHHATQMACAARALVCAASSDHLKRVLGRYAFVHLHDVCRFAPAWRNQLLRDDRARATAEAARPALDRLRADWEHYQDVRHYLGAKRQPRDPSDPAADQLETFKLWADVGQLSIDALVDDAVEVYVQLAALGRLPTLDQEPAVSAAVKAALDEFDPMGQEGFLEVNAASFASTRSDVVSVRMGGQPGRIVPLINDVAESAALLSSVSQADDSDPSIQRLITCALPSEIDELLRLTIGPPASIQAITPDGESLLAHYRRPGKPSDPRTVLDHLDATIPQETRDSLHDWRNRLGAHTDDETPWPVLEEGIANTDLSNYVALLGHIELNLEHAAVTSGGPALLMLGTRQFKTLFESAGYDGGLPFVDASEADAALSRSALPPPGLDTEHAIWVNGPKGSVISAAVAGMLAGRSREVTERLEARNRSLRAKNTKR